MVPSFYRTCMGNASVTILLLYFWMLAKVKPSSKRKEFDFMKQKWISLMALLLTRLDVEKANEKLIAEKV